MTSRGGNQRWIGGFPHDSVHKDGQASHFSAAKTSRCHSTPLRLRGPAAAPPTSSGPTLLGPLLTLSPVRPRMWTFYLHWRPRLLPLGSEAQIHEQQAVEHRAPLPDTRLAALALLLAVHKCYWPTRFSIVIGRHQSFSAIRQYECSATRDMTAAVRRVSNQRRAAKKNVEIGRVRLVDNTGGRRYWPSVSPLWDRVGGSAPLPEQRQTLRKSRWE